MPNPNNMYGIDFSQYSEDPNAKFNVGNAGKMYGLSGFDPTQTRQNLETIARRNIDTGTRDSFERAIASGQANPEVSSYNATQSAMDSMSKASADLDEKKYKSQFDLFNAMMGAEGSKLARDTLNEQHYQYEDQKPDLFSSLLDLGMGAIPFLAKGGKVKKKANAKVKKVMDEWKAGKLYSSSGQKVTDHKQALAIAMSEAGLSNKEDGGEVSMWDNPDIKNYYENKAIRRYPETAIRLEKAKRTLPTGSSVLEGHVATKGSIPTSGEAKKIKDSDYFQYAYGGEIPPEEQTHIPSPDAPTNDNTLINAKTGEHIMTDKVSNLFGSGTLQDINKMVEEIPTGQKGMGVNTMGTGMNKADWFNPNATPMANMGAGLGTMIKGMFNKPKATAGGGNMMASMGLPRQTGGNTPDPKIAELEGIILNLNQQLKSGKVKPDQVGENGMTISEYLSQLGSQLYRLKSGQGTQEPAPQQEEGTSSPNHETTITIRKRPMIKPSMNQQQDQQGLPSIY